MQTGMSWNAMFKARAGNTILSRKNSTSTKALESSISVAAPEGIQFLEQPNLHKIVNLKQHIQKLPLSRLGQESSKLP